MKRVKMFVQLVKRKILIKLLGDSVQINLRTIETRGKCPRYEVDVLDSKKRLLIFRAVLLAPTPTWCYLEKYQPFSRY